MNNPEVALPSAEHKLPLDPTPEQLRALEAGPGVVKVPAKMREIDDDMYLGVNFEAHFNADPKAFGPSIRRQEPAFQRFQILYPELSSSLDRPDSHQGHTQEELRQAYRKMAQLVDQHDPYVMVDGEVDPDYLF